ncbi:MAG TPA: phytanoyl-CoA dioxygenase family protein [Chloroflexota bacterium]|nr:phytanoyl-CoA dioxygenase family protein [Chloroflexota bacterium]
MGLTPAQIEQFNEQGFLIVENVLTEDELAAMRARAEQIARGELAPDSGIRRQVEPGIERGEATAESYELSLRKMVGLALARDPAFEAHAKRPRIVEMVQALLGPDLALYQDQLFMKAPYVGSRQPYHQDQPAGFYIDPPELLVTCWTALDASTEENGCLRYLPGSHKLGPLSREERAAWEARALAGELTDEVPLVLPPGGCGLHHGWLLHASDVNRSAKRRRGYAMHYVSARCRYTGPEPKPDFLPVSGRTYPGAIV